MLIPTNLYHNRVASHLSRDDYTSENYDISTFVSVIRGGEMDGNNESVSSSFPAANRNDSQWPVLPEIGDADLLPDDLSRSLKLTFFAAYTTIIVLALGGNGLMVNVDWTGSFRRWKMTTKHCNEWPRYQPGD